MIKHRIIAMNEKYELPVNHTPKFQGVSRLYQFRNILEKEVNEINDIIDMPADLELVDYLTAIADLLADIRVYCESEAVRFGIPLEEVVHIVIDSNDTKLGPDGKPIKDENGKFLKGPNFVPPEPAIRKLLLERMKCEE